MYEYHKERLLEVVRPVVDGVASLRREFPLLSGAAVILLMLPFSMLMIPFAAALLGVAIAHKFLIGMHLLMMASKEVMRAYSSVRKLWLVSYGLYRGVRGVAKEKRLSGKEKAQ